MTSTPNAHLRAFAALNVTTVADKCSLSLQLWQDWQAGRCQAELGPDVAADPNHYPGRPQRPELVAPQAVPRRRIGTPEGHAALLHAIAHIEFNAIDLALDCVWRFRSMPALFHADWIRIAAEEAEHFELVQQRLRSLGFSYGDLPAHRGLWDMANKTAHDPLARMGMVPRVLEARGLDATPVIQKKLQQIGDQASLAVLDVILRDEVGHVAVGDHWFRVLCQQRGLAPETTYRAMMKEFDAPRPYPPVNRSARLAAGFSQAELDRLLAE